jgi:hypothetical protein
MLNSPLCRDDSTFKCSTHILGRSNSYPPRQKQSSDQPETSAPLNPWHVSPDKWAARSRPSSINPRNTGEPQTDRTSCSQRRDVIPDRAQESPNAHHWMAPSGHCLACFWLSIYLVAKPETVKSLCSQGSTEGLHGQPRANIWALAAVGFFLPSFSARGQDEGNQFWLPARRRSKVIMFPPLLLASPVP